jgi:hypothetical protein
MKPEGPSFPVKLFVFFNFLMLTSLTIAQKPIQKAIDMVEHKHKLKAQAEVCLHIRAKEDVYSEYVRGMFISGCLWDLKGTLIFMAGKDKKRIEEINKAFKEQESSDFDNYRNHCMEGGAAYQREGQITEQIISDLYSHFQCAKVFKELEKLEGNK